MFQDINPVGSGARCRRRVQQQVARAAALVALVSCLAVAPARGQCNGTLGPVVTSFVIPPGTSDVNFSVSNLPFGICILMFGFDNVDWNGAPLPLEMGWLGAPGCYLRIDPVVFPVIPGTYTLQSAAGSGIYAQAVSLDPAANPGGLIFSNFVQV